MSEQQQTTAAVDKNLALNKSQLAKLLATENLTVMHSATARTASFDTVKRLLVLPVWMNMTADVYDLLVGHEVGHALYTDGDELVEGFKALHAKLYPNDDSETSRSARVLHQVINVVEDPRIEKLIKRRYPGIKAAFNRGYKTLWDQGLFGAADQNVSYMSLTDRINLHFKVGTYIRVPFSAVEQPLVAMVENAETMDDVFAAAEAIVLHVRENPMREKQQEPAPQPDTDGMMAKMSDGPVSEDMDDMSEDNEDNDGTEGDGGDDDDADYDQYDTDDPDFEHDDGENDDNNDTEASDGEGADADPCEEGSTGDEDGEEESGSDSDGDSDNDNDDEEDEGESEDDGEEETSETSDGTQDAPVKSFSEYGELDGLRSLTEASLTENTANLADANTFMATVTAPKFDHAALVHDYKRVMGENRQWFANNSSWLLTPHIEASKLYQKSERTNISYMLKEFELRRSARTYARTHLTKTGRLDTNRLHSYKISDDLFRRNTVVPRGQSHGLFFLVDFSGSMSYCIKDLMKALTSITMFCRLSNIPFEVYTFTDGYFGPKGRNMATEAIREDRYRRACAYEEGVTAATDARIHKNVFLRNILSNRMNAAEYNEACAIIRAMAEQQSPIDSMGGTPLLQSLMMSVDLVEKFKKSNGLDSVSFITMTDGLADPFCGTELIKFDNYAPKPGYITYTDKATKKSYTSYSKTASDYVTATSIVCGLVIKSIQDRFNANTIGYFISDRRNIATSLNQLGVTTPTENTIMSAKFKETDFISMKLLGYDEFFVISPKLFDNDNRSMESFRAASTTNPSARKVFSDYKRALGKRDVGRALLKSFVARITARDAA